MDAAVRTGESLLAFGLAAWTWLLASVFLFGDPLTPLLLALLVAVSGYGKLWSFLILMSVAIGVFVAYRIRVDRLFRPTVMIAGTLVIAATIAGIVGTTARRVIIHQFDPDKVHTASFLYSMHIVGKEHVTHPHGVAIKDCVPYIWSWRQMAFERLPDGAIIWVLPREWLPGWQSACAIGAPATGGAN